MNPTQTYKLKTSKGKNSLMKWLANIPFWLIIIIFVLIVAGMTASVLVSSISNAWFATWLPQSYTLHWFAQAWIDYNIWHFYKVTLEVTILSTGISLVLSLPGAYVLARKQFPLKSTIIGFYQLPFTLPEIAYAIPLASLFYKFGLAETIPGLVLAQMLVGIPFATFILIPFIEVLDPRLESAAQSLGASRIDMLRRIVLPQLIPGITSAAINIFIRMFSTFLVILLIAGPQTQTLTVMVFSVLQSAGSQAPAEISSVTISLMFPLLGFTFISLWFSAYVKKRTRQLG